MRHFDKWISVSLAAATIFGLAACGGGGEDSSSSDGGTHDAIVAETDIWFVRNGRSDYKILLPEEADDVLEFAANELNYFLGETAGVTLDVVHDDGTADAADKYLSVGNTSLCEASGVSVDYDVFGTDGYVVRTEENSVLMLGGGSLGSLYAAYDFIERNLGAQVYAEEEILIKPAEDIRLLDFDVKEIPDIERRAISSYQVTANQTHRRRLRFVSNSDNWTYWTHSHFALMPKETYFEEHSDWYSPDGTQLCLTNEEMTAQMIENVTAFLEEHPNDEYITLGQQDSNTFCTCSICSEQVLRYRESGVMIRFINKVARGVQANLDASGSGRKIRFATYAYQRTQSAPVSYENGEYTPLDESVIPDDNVAVLVAPLSACYCHSMLDPDCNATAKQTVEGWHALGTTIYMRLYTAQYAYYFMPFMGWSELAENYGNFADLNVRYIFDTAVGETVTPGFQEMLAYVKSKLMWNTSLDIRALMDDFMRQYYKQAYEPMKEMFMIYETQWATLENLGYHLIPSASQGDRYANTEVFPRGMLNALAALEEEAMTAIAPIEAEDEALYLRLKNRIECELVPVIYWRIELYPEYFTVTQLSDMIDELERICNTVGIDRWAEYNSAAGADKSISTLVSEWRTELL